MRLKIVIVILCFWALPVTADEAVRTVPKTFQECVDQGGRVQEISPPVCVSREGIRFVEQPTGRVKTCEDRCGDGQCQEIVCMAIGCPCAESPMTCPKDCPK
jgi:hypothetical protein